ncbi:MAG TPA: erythromycin esterase family protein [Chloroflexia bacterium]|nr:erythromycin esterase family protein [Chloroflexia bacterium]
MLTLRKHETKLLDRLKREVRPLTGGSSDYDPLLDLIGDARLVLIGEASHGTHEFYRERAEITRRLITDKGFGAVAVEADWPTAYHINRYVRAMGGGTTAIEALAEFTRFPMWMWRNADVLDFVGWLRSHNDQVGSEGKKTGFYGLDLYSMYGSIEAVLKYLEKVDPEGAKRARYRYSCFEHFGEDTQAYGYAASFGLTQPCEDEVLNQLVEIQRCASEYAQGDGTASEDEFFYAEQNARLVKNAEQYYRTMFSGRVSSWNLRDTHMADTLDALLAHLDRKGGKTKVVVWAHNSHLGDAAATQMGESGEINIGHLARERHGDNAFLLGFSTYTGTVTAANNWDEPGKRKEVRPGIQGSYEALFHEVGIPRFMVALKPESTLSEELREARLQRAIGVIYRPETERMSHYFEARLSDQFDAMIHIDETRAVEPLDREGALEPTEGEMPDTFPTGQ